MEVSPLVVKPADESSGGRPVKARDPFTLIIFGASGDLARRKLVPALFHLQQGGFLPEKYAVLGMSRTPMSDDAYRDAMCKALQDHLHEEKEQATPAHELIRSLYYVPGNVDDPAAFARLKEKLDAIDAERGLPGNRLFYLSVAPEHFGPTVKNLSAAGLIYGKGEKAWSRVIIEKPFGRDLESARALNAEIGLWLHESQIYRIDHYLGKETVQNLLSFRFGNSIFEPLFNHTFVDNVQITVAETLGMEGRRGAYFDTAGTLRDMVQNHMLQLLTLVAMEPPSAMESQAIRDEKVKVLRAIEPMTPEQVGRNTVRGQYGVGELDGKPVKAYRQEEGVDPKSTTESYVAVRLGIDNWRWAGVPFFLRSGKRLRRRVSEVAVTFRQPPLHLFRELVKGTPSEIGPPSNLLVMRIQPDEGISLSFACKQPGMRIRLQEVRMDFVYGQSFQQRSPEAYERLLLDALRGDASLFTRSDEVDYAWRFISSIHDGWWQLPPPKFPNYYPFTDGPDEAERLLEGTRARWRPLVE